MFFSFKVKWSFWAAHQNRTTNFSVLGIADNINANTRLTWPKLNGWLQAKDCLSHYLIPETSRLPSSSALKKKKSRLYFSNCSQKIHRTEMKIKKWAVWYYTDTTPFRQIKILLLCLCNWGKLCLPRVVGPSFGRQGYLEVVANSQGFSDLF